MSQFPPCADRPARRRLISSLALGGLMIAGCGAKPVVQEPVAAPPPPPPVQAEAPAPVKEEPVVRAPSCAPPPVYFDFDSSTLRNEAQTDLKRTAECLKSLDARFRVAGHADVRGTEEYNLVLSDRRARQVAGYLGKLGVGSDRLTPVARGEAYATGTDESGWARDRRAEFEN